MKKKVRIFIILSIVFVTLISSNSFSQQWSGTKKNRLLKDWSINVNTGFTSYFGDLSYYDSSPIKKLQNESGPGLGIILNKFITPAIGIAGQYLHGHLKGGNSNQEFKTDFLEYNLQVRIDFVELLVPGHAENFNVVGYAGIGQCKFATTTSSYNEGKPIVDKQQTGIPEFILVFGSGVSYKIAPNLFMTADISLRASQNDKLDNYSRGSNNDFYSYQSIGITYTIKSLTRSAKGGVKSGLRQDKSKKYNRLVSN